MYPCHNTEEVVAQTGYDPEQDLSATRADSVFCAHGAGFHRSMERSAGSHACGGLAVKKERQSRRKHLPVTRHKPYDPDHWIEMEEIDAILARTYHANKHESADADEAAGAPPKNRDLGVQCAVTMHL